MNGLPLKNCCHAPPVNIYLLLIVFAFFSCNPDEMKFELKEHKELRGIPSASGLEITEGGIYVIGDDSPWLFQLDKDYNVTDKIELFPDRNFVDNIIAKILKPDLEALAKGNKEGTRLLAFGSGSKSPERDIVVEIDLPAKTTTEYSLKEFYLHLREVAGLSENELNIEAAEVYQDDLFLFNRGKNLIIKCSLSQFRLYLKEKGPIPALTVFRMELPKIEGITAGFSGASVDPENGILFFTATVENTSNWFDDGEVLGSFIGKIEFNQLKDNMKPLHTGILKDMVHLKIKVESIAVLQPYNREKAEILMVTDSDGGVSEILQGTLFH